MCSSDLINGQFSGNDTNQTWPSADPYTSGEDSFLIRVFDTAVSDADWGEGMVQQDDGDWVLENPGNIPTSGYYNYYEFTGPTKSAAEYDLIIAEDLVTNRLVPEPSSFVLMTLAGLILAFHHRRRLVG